MVGCGDDDYVAGQCVNLKQKRADNALYFAGLVRVSALFAKSVKFIKKQNAVVSSSEVE